MKSLLVLARVSNLPTVWSNCLAAWLLAAGMSWHRFALLCLGTSLLYIGGMFLNDAVDQEFDRRFRPERPIVAGQISAHAVWVFLGIWLSAGWLAMAWLGGRTAVVGSILLLVIVVYDLVHKRTALAPLLMSACRFLLYLVAAAAAGEADFSRVWIPAGALTAYIIGLSYIARVESRAGTVLRWPLPLLFAPAVAWCIWNPGSLSSLWPILACQVAWTIWCLLPRRFAGWIWVPQGVAGLLAGIVFVDWLAVAGAGHSMAFVSLFLLALLLQRIAPAT